MATISPTVADLLATMTVAEKLAQLQGLWIEPASTGAIVAPEMDTVGPVDEFAAFARDGLGQLTRIYGTAPVSPAEGLSKLIGCQSWLADHTRCRIGALAHEECLTGLAAWGATTYPTPLAWACTFDPALVRRMGADIGATMAALGVHQGLAPVLDVVRDARWGRVEETMGEDPYVIGELASAYVQGLQSRGIVATLKHFMGYSASQAGRNLAPVHAGPREMADVFAIPFEMAVLDGQARAVMPAYVDIDGVPMHAHREYLTGLLRDRWGFTGTVVSDYFGVEFLQRQHGVVEDLAGAAVATLSAGIDVELPTGVAFRAPGLPEAVATDPGLAQALDAAVARVLTQKEALGLLDLDAELARLEGLAGAVPATLDPPEHRATAAALAEESVVLLDNPGAVLPLRPSAGAKLAVIGPNADRAAALFGCYSFVNHVLMHHPGVESQIAAPSILEAIRAEYSPAGVSVGFAEGCTVRDDEPSDLAGAVALAEGSDVVIAVVGDQAGLFGTGTSGEGCDTDCLDLPGVQRRLVEALLETGKPVVLVLVTGRPYAIAPLAGRAAATIQAFFPGEAGAQAVAGVLSGRLNPSGHLPVSIPQGPGVLPYSYLHAKLGDTNSVSSIDTTPQYCFGHGLSYTSFDVRDFEVTSTDVPTDGWIEVRATVANTGGRDGTHLLQVYGRDPVAQVARPVCQLLAFARVDVPAGAGVPVAVRIPTTRLAYAGLDLVRVVEPGEVLLWLGWDAGHPATDPLTVRLTGPVLPVGPQSPRLCEVTLGPAA